jgi:hypothetical protein
MHGVSGFVFHMECLCSEPNVVLTLCLLHLYVMPTTLVPCTYALLMAD